MASLGDEITFYSFFIVGGSGLLVKTFLLFLIARNKALLRGEYMPFVINRALIDIVFCLNLLTLEPVSFRYRSIDYAIYCKIAGALCLSLSVTALISEAVLGVNRFFFICHPQRYQKLYRKRLIVYSMFFLVWPLGLINAVIHIMDDSLGLHPGFFCSLKLESKYLLVFVLTEHSAILVSYSILIYCYRKIYLHIKLHQEQVNNNNNMTQLSEDKNLLRYIGAMAVLPVLTDTPITIVGTIQGFMPGLLPNVILAMGSLALFSSGFFNSLFTLFMLRPIKKEMYKFWNKLFNNNNSIGPQVVSVVVQPSRDNVIIQ